MLNRAEAAGQIERPFFADPSLDLLVQLGLAHDWCLKLGVADCVLKIAWRWRYRSYAFTEHAR